MSTNNLYIKGQDGIWRPVVVGARGPQGAAGPQGSQGLRGFQGFQGGSGPQGSQGGAGSQGAQGGTGPQGVQGLRGFQGFQGFQGAPGAQGAQGGAGPQGTPGTQGVGGTQGPQGSQGAQGPSGGPVGPQGAQGAQGPTGNMALSIPGTDLTASGPTISGIAAAAVIAGRVVRLPSSGGGWRHAQASSETNTQGLLGIALTSAAAAGTVVVALPGAVVRVNSMTHDTGTEMFLSTTVWGGLEASGAQTYTTGQVVQSLGTKLSPVAILLQPGPRIVFNAV
jgi:hypothetical protein